MIFPIILYGDPVLRKRAEEIPLGTDVMALAQDMFETMHQASGIGLAAPQIGKSIRLFVVDASPLEEKEIQDFKKIFINPTITTQFGDEWPYEEGCLSIPGIRDKVLRKSTLHIKYYDENWQLHEEEYDGMKARIIQHEYDHLEGVLFIDYLTAFKKRILKSKLSDISKGITQAEYRIKASNR